MKDTITLRIWNDDGEYNIPLPKGQDAFIFDSKMAQGIPPGIYKYAFSYEDRPVTNTMGSFEINEHNLTKHV